MLQYLLDDVSDFLSMQCAKKGEAGDVKEEKGCLSLLKAFIDYITEREKENFRSRRHDNENSVTLTTIHQVFLIHSAIQPQTYCVSGSSHFIMFLPYAV